jgi:hypothetical protein
MAADPESPEHWQGTYFNYFTEIEEHFQRARGTALFLLSPLDWALIESWKNGGIPLAAVLRGIDVAFEKWRAKKTKTQAVNSLAYCAQAIGKEAEAMAKGGPSAMSQPDTAAAAADSDAPFTLAELESYFAKNVEDLMRAGLSETADALAALKANAAAHYRDLEELEQRLTALEEKMIATVRSRMTDDDLFAARRELDLQLKPYRSKMNAQQLSMLERQFLERKILESNNLPRLSLFYLR